MKCLSVLFVIIGIAVALAGQEHPATDRTEQKFRTGGLVRIRLSSGGYTISGTDSNDIAVNCDKPNSAKIRIKTTESAADISITDTPSSNFNATIEVPRRSDLWVRLSAGELKVANVEGDKDVESKFRSLRERIQLHCVNLAIEREIHLLA